MQKDVFLKQTGGKNDKITVSHRAQSKNEQISYQLFFPILVAETQMKFQKNLFCCVSLFLRFFVSALKLNGYELLWHTLQSMF